MKTTAEDEQMMAAFAVSKYGGLSMSALIRLALRCLAQSDGIWEPPKPSAGAEA